jgi:hypothetical protein
MRRTLGSLTASLLVMAVAACSPGFFDVGGTEFHLAGPDAFTHPQEQGVIPFIATGRPVDEDVVCGSGIMTIDHLESRDGETITGQDWADMFDAAMEDEGIAELYSFQDLECEDGSGSFRMEVHHRFNLATFRFEGEQDTGFWKIEGGTGSYSDLSGSGDVTLDWDIQDVKYDGDVR